jgi:hypothetical protein
VADGVGLGDGDGLVGVGAGVGDEVAPPMFTENELVARPAPPCQSSNPASTSIRYQLGLV